MTNTVYIRPVVDRDIVRRRVTILLLSEVEGPGERVPVHIRLHSGSTLSSRAGTCGGRIRTKAKFSTKTVSAFPEPSTGSTSYSRAFEPPGIFVQTALSDVSLGGGTYGLASCRRTQVRWLWGLRLKTKLRVLVLSLVQLCDGTRAAWPLCASGPSFAGEEDTGHVVEELCLRVFRVFSHPDDTVE